MFGIIGPFWGLIEVFSGRGLNSSKVCCFSSSGAFILISLEITNIFLMVIILE